MQIQSGRTVPLTVHTFSERLFFHLVVHQLYSHRHGHCYQHPLQHKQVQCTIMRNVHIMYNILCSGGAYYVPDSFLLISNKFCNGGSGPSRAIKFQYAPERRDQGD
jgi:hypothetical protein